jgi:YesN/AraC family two-component response regulator
MLAEPHIGLILLDINMPVMAGLSRDCAKHVQGFTPSWFWRTGT